MKFTIASIILLFTLITKSLSQNLDKIIKINTDSIQSNSISDLEYFGVVKIPSHDLELQPILTDIPINHHPSINKFKIDSIKLIRDYEQDQYYKVHSSSQYPSNILTKLIVGNSFSGGARSSNPMDNDIAISDKGVIVSVDNGQIWIGDKNGKRKYFRSLNDFIQTAFNNIGLNPFDPNIIYDPYWDRFILVCCTYPMEKNEIVVLFSEYNDPGNPSQGWHAYKFKGDPTNKNRWFDFPRIGISDREVFITGNLFTQPDIKNNADYVESVIFQIHKLPAYEGNPNPSNKVWYNLPKSLFTLNPATLTFKDEFNIGLQGMYFISSIDQGGNNYYITKINRDLNNAPEIEIKSILWDNYQVPGNATQKNGDCKLKTNDCRITSAYYSNGIIHFAHNVHIGSGFCGIQYGRYNTESNTIECNRFGEIGVNYAYPAIAPIRLTKENLSVIIGFSSSSKEYFPQHGFVECDNSLDFRNSVLIKDGNSAIECDNPKDINNTRWGDYNGIQKDYSIDPSVHNVSVWLSGTFSFYGARKTWISNIIENSTTNVGEVKIKNDFKLFPNPVQQEFTTSFNIKKSSKYHFKIIDESGKDYKNLFYGNLNSGEKRLTFIKDSIPQGIYFIVLLENGIIIHSEKFVIID